MDEAFDFSREHGLVDPRMRAANEHIVFRQ
jgi:hypothetical protein